MVDIHAHILPRMDDGSKSMAQTFEMLDCMRQQGGETVVATSHFDMRNESIDKYLDRVNPSIAVVSCGADNTFKHPNKQTIDTLEERDVQPYITAYDGNIIITSDGKYIDVICQNKNV